MTLVPETEVAFGGIVFDDKGRVLIRKPAGNWGGYIWTFAKGMPEPILDPTPETTALREVREETGYTCEIVAAIPGHFESDTCFTSYYLMRPLGDVGEFDFETEEIRWTTIPEAIQLLSLTTTPKGRERDLAALSAAVEVHKELEAGPVV